MKVGCWCFGAIRYDSAKCSRSLWQGTARARCSCCRISTRSAPVGCMTSQPCSFGPMWPTCLASGVNSADRLNLVIEPIRPDTHRRRPPILPVPSRRRVSLFHRAVQQIRAFPHPVAQRLPRQRYAQTPEHLFLTVERLMVRVLKRSPAPADSRPPCSFQWAAPASVLSSPCTGRRT